MKSYDIYPKFKREVMDWLQAELPELIQSHPRMQTKGGEILLGVCANRVLIDGVDREKVRDALRSRIWLVFKDWDTIGLGTDEGNARVQELLRV